MVAWLRLSGYRSNLGGVGRAAGATGAILWGVISWSRDRAFQAADRRRQIELIESEQARKVGFALSPKARDSDVYLATVYNTSELPIRKVNVMAAARIVQDEKTQMRRLSAFLQYPLSLASPITPKKHRLNSLGHEVGTQTRTLTLKSLG